MMPRKAPAFPSQMFGLMDRPSSRSDRQHLKSKLPLPLEQERALDPGVVRAGFMLQSIFVPSREQKVFMNELFPLFLLSFILVVETKAKMTINAH